MSRDEMFPVDDDYPFGVGGADVKGFQQADHPNLQPPANSMLHLSVKPDRTKALAVADHAAQLLRRLLNQGVLLPDEYVTELNLVRADLGLEPHPLLHYDKATREWH